MKNIGLFVSSILIGCLGFSGCGGGSNKSNSQSSSENKTLVSITVTGADAATSVAVGASLQLTAEGSYSDGTVSNITSQVTWASSNSSLAKANPTGLLTTYQPGSVTVTAALGSITGSMALSVSKAALSTIRVLDATSLAAGSSEQLAAQGNYTDSASQAITSQVTWQSSDTTVASVSNSGLLTSIKAGTVTITATMNSVSGTASITVTSSVLTAINVSVPFPSLSSGATEQLAATGLYSDNTTQLLASQAIWSTSDPTIASVNGAGFLTALKAGSVTVTASMGGVSGTGAVVVSAPSLSSIAITPAVFSIGSGQTKQLSAKGIYSDGTTQNVSNQVTWNSLSTGSATVSATGLVSGASAGISTITATLGSVTGSAMATVTAAQLQSIVVTPATASIATGQTQAFAANGIFSDGSSTDMTDSVIWSSSATKFATVDTNGLATGVSAGAAMVTATSGTVSGSAALTVTTAVLTEVDISPDAQTIPIGGQVQLTLTGTYSDSTTQTLTNATWSSSDPSFASVDPALGNVTGVANSNGYPITITATSNGLSDTTTVFVTAAVMESLAITPATDSIASGTSVQYSVSANYSDGSMQPLTSGLSWISSLAAIAGVDANGVATGIAPGQATITVSYASMTGSATLTVTPATLTSIVVTPVLDQVGVNGNVQFTATGVFTDSSTQDLTAQVSWGSSAAGVALINNTGLATGLSLGTSTITATYGGLSGSTTLTVATSTLVSITIAPANPILPPNARLQMTAYGNFSDGSQIPLSGVQWRTNSGKSHTWWGGYYATISRSGLLRTRRSVAQPIQITATLNGITGTTTLTVTTMSVTSLQLTPATPTIAVGTTLPFKLIGTFSDGITTVDLSNSARWQTSSWRYAVMDNSGVVYGRSVGSVTISGSYGGLTPATTTLTVSNATLQGITVNPANPTILLGALQPFTAVGLFSDGSTQDITAISRWTSSTPGVAVINRSGVAWSASHGQTNINANVDGVTGSTLLNIN
ncbi:MAG: Ig-like domain-containing protein [Terracidiphilus sp.]